MSVLSGDVPAGDNSTNIDIILGASQTFNLHETPRRSVLLLLLLFPFYR